MSQLVQKITGKPNVDRSLQRIREFRNRPEINKTKFTVFDCFDGTQLAS